MIRIIKVFKRSGKKFTEDIGIPWTSFSRFLCIWNCGIKPTQDHRFVESLQQTLLALLLACINEFGLKRATTHKEQENTTSHLFVQCFAPLSLHTWSGRQSTPWLQSASLGSRAHKASWIRELRDCEDVEQTEPPAKCLRTWDVTSSNHQNTSMRTTVQVLFISFYNILYLLYASIYMLL